METFSTQKFIVNPGGKINGTLRVPGDKSISHRAIMLGALAKGITQINGFLDAEDTNATLDAFKEMGVPIEETTSGELIIHGVGLHGLQAPSAPLYLGNSGTAIRLLTGIMAGQTFSVEIGGDESLSRRPMRRITEPLNAMGAHVLASDNDNPPLIILDKQRLQGIDYTLPIPSAQIKSCLLLAGLYANGTTCVTEPVPTRDHTERMLHSFGYPIKREGRRVCLQGGGKLQGISIDVPADISSAAFFIVATIITKGGDLLLNHVGINPTRTGVINILRQMGANITLHNQRNIGGEQIADIHVRSSSLHGIKIPQDQVPLAIDEFPIIFIAAACAKGETVLTGAEELRVKESDRIQVMADGLRAIGIDAKPTTDGMVVRGGKIRGGVVNSCGDHRVAMAFTMAALCAKEAITIEDCTNVSTSFPNFVNLAQETGIDIKLVNQL
ncbi:3-phosphoshikimate 1-carboxyvinyltransferase [Candidatus Marithioploca araucensis]|uniref:3-phosphoshikimate 1-carboxyvinyltransferase n=1 Tax=Candidatus Marithioploca araucensis TaxID=70273 RepID=A0ABT7VU13_9GAMM|nr:3-phosphoshikimate 1-carboxyvinyltransferase [Candidatus Marithioploca araucensis]